MRKAAAEEYKIEKPVLSIQEIIDGNRQAINIIIIIIIIT